MDNIEKKILNSTKWSSLAEISSKLITPIVNMLLARLLTPSMFGIVATINIVITFAEIFQDAGFQKYIIQHKFDDDNDFDQNANVAFWSNLFLSIFLYSIIVIFKNNISTLISDTSISNEIMVAGLSLPIFAFSSIQIAYYKRNFNFKKLFWVRIITSLVPIMVTVPLAIIFRNHWSLIIGTVGRNLIQTFVLYVGTKWKPSLKFNVEILKKMLSFCVWTLAESITIWFTANVSVFIVNLICGTEIVGMYKTSMATVTSITSLISVATLSVLFPALSRLQDDDEHFKAVFYDYQKTTGILLIPLGVGIFAYRELFTLILLGNQWLDCADFIGHYALFMSIAIITNSFFSELYRAKGRPKWSVVAQILYIVILIPVIYISASKGFDMLSIATSLSMLIFAVIHSIIAKSVFKMKIFIMIKNLFLIFIPSAIMFIASQLFLKISDNIVWVIASIILCILVYFSLIFIIKPLRKTLEENKFTKGIYIKIISFKERLIKK